jgi:CPA2 family monovalent cation:H+ antiporter-2
MLLLAVPLTIVGKALAGYLAGRVGGFTDRQSLNAGLALVAHGEFTIILAEVAARNGDIPAEVRGDIVAFAGLYVLATATLGVVLMKESKRLGRAVFPLRRLVRQGVP